MSSSTASWASAAAAVYGAYEKNKKQNDMAKAAAAPKTSVTTKTPYFNSAISQLIPYILNEQQNIYESRSKAYGRTAGSNPDFSAMLDALKNSGYQGVSTSVPADSQALSGLNPYSHGQNTQNMVNTINTSASGYHGSSGAGSDLPYNAQSSEDMNNLLTDKQRAGSSYHLTPEQMQNIGKFLGNQIAPGLGTKGLELYSKYYDKDGNLRPMYDKSLDHGQSTQDPNKIGEWDPNGPNQSTGYWKQPKDNFGIF